MPSVAVGGSPSATDGETTAVCFEHTAKRRNPVVIRGGFITRSLKKDIFSSKKLTTGVLSISKNAFLPVPTMLFVVVLVGFEHSSVARHGMGSSPCILARSSRASEGEHGIARTRTPDGDEAAD